MTVEKWLGENNKLGLDIFNKKYRYNNESFIDFLNRVSNGNKTIYNLLSEKKFIPGGRILANINTDRGANTNCAVLPGNDLDSIEKIMDRCKEMALLFKQGIGLGFNVGSIRPKGAKTSDGGSAPGIIPFMELFSSVTGAIASGGRRGASLLFCDAYHPQIIDFCKCKLDKTNNITNANISIWVDDEFMSKAELGIIENKHYIIEATGESIEYILDYKKVIDTAIECGVTSAEPGILFSDTYKNNAITQYIPEYTPTGVNGCCFTGDMKLLTIEGYKRFDEIVGTEQSIYDKNGSVSLSKIWNSGIKDVYEVKMGSKSIIKCTDNHVFLTIDNKEIEAKNLKGCRIMPNTNLAITHDDWYTKLGYIQGDGGTGRLLSERHKKLEVYIGDKDADISKLFNITNESFNSLKRSYYVDFDMDKMIELGVCSNPRPTRQFPFTYNNWTFIQKSSFLRGLFSANGHALLKANRVCLSTTSESEANAVIQTLKEDFNIKAYITTKKAHDVKWKNGTYTSKDGYTINIADYESRVKFSEFIGFVHQYKQDILKQSLIQSSPIVTSVKYIKNEIVYDFNEPNVNYGVVNGFIAHNSEFAGTDYATCLLGSINLSEYVEGNRFDYSSLINDTIEIIVYLNKVLDDGIYKLPIQEMKDVALDQRQLGLGVMGLADTFIKLGIKYGSKDSCDFSASVMKAIASASLYSSSLLAKKNGCVYEKDLIMKSDFVKNVLEDCGKDIINSVTNNGLYNTRLLAIAPTGSLATMLGISSGIEPIYKKSYKRRTQSLHGEDVIYDVEHQAILDYKKLNPTASISHIVDAHEIEWKDKLQLLSSIQKYVDNAISNTLNLHKGTTVDEVRDVYMYAWKNGLKGVAIYVDGSLDTQILMDSKDSKDKKEDSQIKIPDDTTYYKREIIHGCGSINIMIGYSNSQKRIIDVYGIPNSNGGCTLNITAQLVYISHILRTTNLKDIERAINGLTACPSYVISKVTKGLKNGKNCATAILETLKAFENEMNDVVIINKDNEIPFEDGISCKKCGALIALKDGCHPCPKCGVINCS